MALPLKHKTLSGALINEIRQSIMSGRFAAGSQLRQDVLAETYGVSRIPVREVLFQLEAEGLVRILPQKGAVVSELSPDEIDDVFDLRLLLEPRLFAASAPKLDADDFTALDSKQAEYMRAIADKSVDDYGRLNAELHMAMYRHAGMPRTLQIVGALLQTSDRYTRVQLSSELAMATAMKEHAQLIELCRKKQFEAGADLLRRHIEEVRLALFDVLTQDIAPRPQSL